MALGGANYRRNVAMLDDDGKEVPGTKGYKYVIVISEAILLADFVNSFRYFGRAKDLPGVRELFQSKKKEEDEENQVENFYRKFTNQGPSYFGDMDENDGSLLESERQAEEDGTYCLPYFLTLSFSYNPNTPHSHPSVHSVQSVPSLSPICHSNIQ